MDISTEFDIKDRVVINGDSSVIATVQRVMIAGNGTMLFEVSWFDSTGSFKEHWMYAWQLTKAK
jgi:hypothetical protein